MENGDRAGKTDPKEFAARNPESKTPATPPTEKFSRKTRPAKGVRTRATAVAARPEGDGGNNSLWQEPGRPGRLAPTALASGRTNRSKTQPGDSPGDSLMTRMWLKTEAKGPLPLFREAQATDARS